MILLYLLPRNAGLANGFKGLHPGRVMDRHCGATINANCVTFAHLPLSDRV